jgi:16S rRNA U516 pseudouridylate synthase RsuA-like enzyme
MHEGRNRQIRRTFAKLGYDTLALKRLSFGDYFLNDLAVGSFKIVD